MKNNDLISDIMLCLGQAGIHVDSEHLIQEFIDNMKAESIKTVIVTEDQAVEALVHWYRNDADMDDLAREYSRILTDSAVQVVRVGGLKTFNGDSDVFQNGERLTSDVQENQVQ